MPAVNLPQTAFTGGELSPRVQGRTDIDRYATGLKRCYNAHPVIHGGFKRRGGTLFAAVATSATAGASILLPFVEGADKAWMLEAGNNVMRVYNADGTAAGIDLASPFTSAMLLDVDWAQSDATMWLFHPMVLPHRLQRLAANIWVLSPAPFTQLPFDELGHVLATTLTLSAATVGTGRTATASAASFVAADVGRGIISGAGIGVITGYTDTTHVTIEITRAFDSVNVPAGWTLEGSPQTTCTPSAKDPVGAAITLTLGAPGWRAGDVGSVVRINGGLCLITSYSSDIIVNAKILRELTATVAAPALAWSLECPVWSASFGYPRSGSIYQQRLIAAGTAKQPRTVWGSRSGEPLHFERWTNDDDSFAFTIDSDESTAIRFVSAGQELAVFTESAEYSMRGGVEKPITPTNVRVKPESNHGCAQVRPAQINRETVFVQRAGRKVRAYGYRYDFDGFSSPDVSAIAEHITKGGVTSMTYAQEAEQMLWAARGDGCFLSCTVDRDQQPSVLAWAQHQTDGFVEWVSSIPNGDREQVWMIVRRQVNGATVRYIERMDDALEFDIAGQTYAFGVTVDSGLVFKNPAGQTSFSVPHLIGKTVDIVADGSKMSPKVVPDTGIVTINRPGFKVVVGLHFRSEVTLLTPEVQTVLGSAQGQQVHTGRVVVKFLESISARVRNNDGEEQEIPWRTLDTPTLDAPPVPYTGLLDVSSLGWSKGYSEITVVQDEPMPFHVLAVYRRHSITG
ncbi:MAG TPA: hypothetical protein VN201_13585 [Roseateles sp.]|nr:hypothetical protein [Roseateles sp.]